MAIAPGWCSGYRLGRNHWPDGWADVWADDGWDGFGIGGQQGWILQPLGFLPFDAAALPLTTLVDLGCQPFFHGRQKKDHAAHQREADQSQGAEESLTGVQLTLTFLNRHSAIAADQ